MTRTELISETPQMLLSSFDYRPRTRVIYGPGEFGRLGEIAREFGARRCLLVADPTAVESGVAKEAARSLKARRVEVFEFFDFSAPPTPAMIEAGRVFAAPHQVDYIVAVGRGTALDVAKAVNLVLTNGGSISAYWGYGKASRALLPMIAVPTSAGSGAEVLSTTVIFDPETGKTMSCGDSMASFRAAVLDPQLTLKQPQEVTAATGFDAIAHAVEAQYSTRRNIMSELLAREAWKLLDTNFERVIRVPEDEAARGGMLIGAHLAGLAAENSALGPAHACATPLSAGYPLTHGASIALVLPAVVEWLAEESENREELSATAKRLSELRAFAELPVSLGDAGVPDNVLPRLADEAAEQWTARFGPKVLDSSAAFEIYKSAY